MQPTTILRNRAFLNSLKQYLKDPHPLARNSAQAQGPDVAKLATRIGWTGVWFATAVTGVLGWPFMVSKLKHGKVVCI